MLFLFFFDAFPASAQFNCETFLKDAEQYYASGNYDTVIANLERAQQECNLNRIKKQDALVLIIKSYIEKDNLEERDRSIKRLLQLNPNYSINNSENLSSFSNALSRYATSPLISFGLNAGFNLPITHTRNVYSILDGADYSKRYHPKISFQASATLEAQIIKYLSVCLEPGISNVSYSRTITGSNNWKLVFTETQSNIDWLGFLKLSYPFKKFKIYLECGYDFTQVRKSFADVELSYEAYNSINQQNVEYNTAANKINLMDDSLRVHNIDFIVTGLGGSYRINNVIFSIDVKYLLGNDNLVDTDHRFDNKLLTFDYYYVDNDIDINRFQVQGGIAYVIAYRIKKKR